MNQIEGLFLSVHPYTDNSAIVHLFTKEYGRKAFIFKGLRKKNTPYVFQPMHFIEFSCSFNVEKSINTGTKQGLVFPCHQITNDIRKTSVALFLTEILNTILKEGDYSDGLYPFIKNSFLLFEIQDYKADFHLLFLVNLLDFLGVGPTNNYSITSPFFNLERGCFSDQGNDLTINKELSYLFSNLLGTTIDDKNPMSLNKVNRAELLDLIFQYLEYHLYFNSNKISSHKILKTVFS